MKYQLEGDPSDIPIQPSEGNLRERALFINIYGGLTDPNRIATREKNDFATVCVSHTGK